MLKVTLDSRREKLVNALMAEYPNEFDNNEIIGISSCLASKLCMRIDKEIKVFFFLYVIAYVK